MNGFLEFANTRTDRVAIHMIEPGFKLL